MLDIQFLVQLSEDEDLRSPVLGVRGPVLQPQQGEAGSGEGEASNPVTPLLLSPDVRNFGNFRVNHEAGDNLNALLSIQSFSTMDRQVNAEKIFLDQVLCFICISLSLARKV